MKKKKIQKIIDKLKNENLILENRIEKINNTEIKIDISKSYAACYTMKINAPFF